MIYILTLLIFITSSYKKLKKEIKLIILALKFNDTPIKKNINAKNQVIIKKQKKERKNVKNKINNEFEIFQERKNDNIFSKSLLVNGNNSGLKINSIKNGKIDNYSNNKYNDILVKKDFELNSLDIKEAKKLDHRNDIEYYLSLLTNNHPLIFSFSSYNDYNSKIIKIFLFFFSFCLDLTINVLFFTNDTMHKIYQDKGQFNFLYFIFCI